MGSGLPYHISARRRCVRGTLFLLVLYAVGYCLYASLGWLSNAYHASRFTAASRANVTAQHFRKYDADNNGVLDASEFQRLVSDLQLEKSNTSVSAPVTDGVDSTTASRATEQSGVALKDKPVVPKAEEQPQKQDSANAAKAANAAKCPELSADVVAKYAKGSTVMVTIGDWLMYQRFGRSWQHNVEKAGISYWIIATLDDDTSAHLAEIGTRCFHFPYIESEKGREYKYGSAHYIKALWGKVAVIKSVLDLGYDVLCSDMDVVWFADPYDYFHKVVTSGDFLVSSDLISTTNTPGDAGLEMGAGMWTNVNTGMYYVRNTPGGKTLMKEWYALNDKHLGNDQESLYNYLRREGDQRNPAYPRMFMADGGKVAVGVLPVSVFMNSYSFFIPRLDRAVNVKRLALHATWTSLNLEGKQHKLREAGAFLDPEVYYRPDKVMLVDITAPSAPEGYNHWRETEDMIKFHLKAITEQLRQVWRAFALALATGRVLVLPRVQCFCYRNWFMMEQCRIPGDSVTQFPFNCTLDQFMRPKKLYHAPALRDMQLEFREYSFLENERVSPQLWTDITPVIAKDEPGCTPPCGRKGPEGAWLVPTNGTEKELLAALAPVASRRVLRFQNILDTFRGWSDPALQAEYQAWLDALTANWCCRDAKEATRWNESIKVALHMAP